MSLEHIALIIAGPILVLSILWPPILDFIGPPWRFLQRRRMGKTSNEVTFSVEIPNALAE